MKSYSIIFKDTFPRQPQGPKCNGISTQRYGTNMHIRKEKKEKRGKRKKEAKLKKGRECAPISSFPPLFLLDFTPLALSGFGRNYD